MRSIPRIAAAGAVLLPFLAACATTDPGPGDPTSDGALVLYSGRSESLIQPLVEEFEADTGIDVDVRYGGTTELAALLLEEGDRSPADVFLSQDAGALGAVSGAGLFATLPEDVAGAVLEGFTSADGTWTGVTGRARVLVYDSEDVSPAELPSSVSELTAPSWRGRVGVPPGNASFQSFVTAYRVLEGDDAAADWLSGLVSNDVERYESNGAILEAVNSGRLDAGLINHYYWFRTAAEVSQMRARLHFFPAGDPGALVNVSGAGILGTAADDADALELVRYLISAEAQTYFVETTYEYPLLPGVAEPQGLPALADLRNPELDLSDLATLQETVDLIAAAGLA